MYGQGGGNPHLPSVRIKFVSYHFQFLCLLQQRGFSGNNPGNYPNSQQGSYGPNQNIQIQQPNRQGMMQQQMQQQYQPRGQMPMSMQGNQSQQMFQSRQQYSQPQQYQQPPRQQIQPASNYQGGSQGFQGPGNNSGEWEQFFSQSNPNPSRSYPSGASQFNPQAQQSNFAPVDNFRGGMNLQQQQSMMSPENVMQPYPGRGPRGAPMQGRGGGRGGFDQAIPARGFAGRAPRGMMQPELASNEYGNESTQYLF